MEETCDRTLSWYDVDISATNDVGSGMLFALVKVMKRRRTAAAKIWTRKILDGIDMIIFCLVSSADNRRISRISRLIYEKKEKKNEN